MREELIDINDLSDSREVMSRKTPPAITIFVSIVLALIIAVFVWLYFGKKDTYVVANGEIRSSASSSTITLMNGGKLEKIFFSDGDTVHKGDILFQTDCEYYVKQKETLEEQITEKQTDIRNFEKLISSIKQDKNLFNEKTDATYYHQYESYKLELDSMLKQISSSNKQVSDTQKEIEQSISQSKDKLSEVNALHEEYSALYSAIKGGYSYRGSNQTVKNTYNSYKSSLEKAETVYDGCVLTYKSLKEKKEEDPESVSQESIDQAKYSKDAAYEDIKLIKSNMLGEISKILQELEQQKSTYNANIDSYTLKKDALSYDNTQASVRSKIKNSYYIKLNNSIDSLKQEIQSLEAQKIELDEAISKANIVAERDGILVYTQDYSVGDTVNAGTSVAAIIPSTGKYNVVLYIPEHNISEIHVGQKIEYIFSAISVTDFGKVFGEISSISADSFVDQTTGQKYYKANATIDETSLTSDTGETRNLKVGMTSEIHIITGTQSLLSWLLDKLNFK